LISPNVNFDGQIHTESSTLALNETSANDGGIVPFKLVGIPSSKKNIKYHRPLVCNLVQT